MTASKTLHDGKRVAVIIPALNEADNLAVLLPKLTEPPHQHREGGQTGGWCGVDQILVCDNGSTDATKEITLRHGATWVYESRRGYGAACYAGMQALADAVAIVAFVDADLGADVDLLSTLIEPLTRNEADFVLGARVRKLRAPGSTTIPQRIGNWLLPMLVRWGWGHRYADLGPFRAIRRDALSAMNMKDRGFGWTIEMQIRAVELGLRILEIPIPQRRRQHGRSKISGSVRGVMRAGWAILRTCLVLRLTKRRRMKTLHKNEDRALNGS